VGKQTGQVAKKAKSVARVGESPDELQKQYRNNKYLFGI
jgi:hypothetical protein